MEKDDLEGWCSRRNGEMTRGSCQFAGGEVTYHSGTKFAGSNERIEVQTATKFVEAHPSQVATDVRGNLVLLDGTGMDESRESEFRDPERLPEQDYNVHVSVSSGNVEFSPR